MTTVIPSVCLNETNASALRINSIAATKKAKTYLEIGVRRGDTFFNVNIENKFAVDPDFAFDINKYKSYANLHFFATTSDEFFKLMDTKKNNSIKFDIIFIDGLHTFEQALTDFKNSLNFSHDGTVWVIDDTVPTNPYSAFPDRDLTRLFYKKIGYKRAHWHGDVFKMVFAIHDHFTEFSYCTLLNKSQTILWKTKEATPREKIFKNFDDIARSSYFDIFTHADKFNPIPEHLLLHIVGENFRPEYTGSPWPEFIYKMPASYFEE